MRIDLNPGNVVPDSKLEKNGSEPMTAPAGAKDESRFSLSDAPASALAAGALNAPETRTQTVEALRSQIHAGTYQVSSNQVASSVLEQMRVR